MKHFCFYKGLRISGIMIFALLFCQCKNHKKISDESNPAFIEKIVGFTSGTISSESVIRIILAEDNKNAGEIPNSPAPENLFQFKPSIKGQTVWVDKRTLEFRPSDKLKSGQSYNAKFNLGKILKVEKNLSEFDFNFNVVKQSWNITTNGYQTHNENDLVWNIIKGSISAADVIDYEKFREYFKAIQNNKKLKISWEPSSDRRNFNFSIDSVKRTENEETVTISWDATNDFNDVKGVENIIIPSLKDYKVLEVKVIHQPEQFIQIMFSDPIKKNQDFDGLIYLENGSSLEFSVTGNIIKAFPAGRQNGETKLTISEGLMNILGYELKEKYIAELTFEVPKPAVKLTGKGVILPSSKGMIFPFEAVNLNAVDIKIIKIFESNIGHFLQVNKLDGNYELKRAGRLIHKERISLGLSPANLTKWNRFYVDLAKLIEPDQGAIYRIELSFKRTYSLYPCDDATESETEDDETENDDEIESEFSYWDSYEDYYDEYYYDYEDYDWDQRDNPCSDSYYTEGKFVARNILASDLGIITKIGTDQTVFCAITSLLTSDPIQGVEVTLYNFQQQSIGKGITNESGFASIPFNEKPFLLIAKHEKQRGYLRLDDGSSLSLGAFDVSGTSVNKGIKAFIYGERGVWRPGDTLFLTCIIEDKQKLLPENHPVIFELYNPKGQIYARSTKTKGLNGFYNWSIATSPEAITGNYNLNVKVGGTQFNKNIKIETVKPNRLKIDLSFNTKKLTSKSEIKGNLNVLWLHGAVASNLRSKISVTFTPASTSFDKFPAFQFTDPAKIFDSEEETIYDGEIDESGHAQIPGKFEVNNAPGMLNANFITRVFEKGGDFSIDRYSILYSPYISYIGIKTPEGDKRGMLLTDTTQFVDIVVLDENGEMVSRNNVQAYVYKLNWRNWWESEDEELANYIGNTYNEPLIVKEFTVTNGRGRFGFKIERPEWGRFYIRVIDPVSGHSAGKIVYIDWPGWAGRLMRDNPEAASILTFNSDKKDYKVGETAELIIPSSGKGNALISIESGSRIISQKWLKIESNEIRYKFEITPEMSPNVYIYVTLIQPHASTENDMPMRLYGVIPLFVENPETKLSPVIKMPGTIEPLQKFTMIVNEKSGKAMTYSLAIVEEGLLDLTRYKTPDPWKEFYAREALGVRTWDLYDMVIGAYGGKLASILGIGGDENEIDNNAAEKANRFKPVVKYLGPFALKEGKNNTHTITMPNYIGSVRAMVIAGQNGAYGFTEKTVPVKKPLMVLATLPRVLGHGESVKLPVTIFSMDKEINNVKVSIKTNSLLLSENGIIEKTVNFEKAGEKIIEFDIKVANKTGIGKVQVIAVSGKNNATYDIELNVRTANPPITTFVGEVIEKGKSMKIDYELPGMQGTNKVTLEVSGIPPIDVEKRLKYLINYPHGCIEQVTSTAFAQLFLTDLMDLEENFKKSIEKNVKAGILKIQTFQMSGGSFTYWPGQSFYNSWGSSYAGHFLLEAEKKGYSVPSGLKSSWLKSQKQLARQWTHTLHKDPYYHDELDQAYRLYTLALAGEPDMSSMNKLREIKSLNIQAKWRLAAAYALCGQADVSKSLISRETIEIQGYTGINSSYGSRERDWAMILETLTILNDKTQAAVLTKKISEALSSQFWMSTQTTAYCLLSVAKYSKGITTDKLSFSYKASSEKIINVTSGKPLVQINIPVSNGDRGKSLLINNTSNGTLFARIIMEGIPPAGDETEFENNINLEVSYLSNNGNSLNVSKIKQGTDFMAVVSVYNPGMFYYRDLALTQIFPPGWEISNSRLLENELSDKKAIPTYQDIRDDRVMTYFDLAKGEKKTFIVRLNASYLGKYYLTGAYCEAMYDNSISALKKGQWIEIVNAGEN